MVPAHGLLFSNCTMGSLTCGLGGNPHTPSHAGCRVHPVPPGVALSQGANSEITVGTKLAHRSSGETARPDGNLPRQQWTQSHTSTFERIIEGSFFLDKTNPKNICTLIPCLQSVCPAYFWMTPATLQPQHLWAVCSMVPLLFYQKMTDVAEFYYVSQWAWSCVLYSYSPC